MSPAWSRGWKKAVRTVIQLIAGGALTAAVNQFSDGLAPNIKPMVLAAFTVLITLCQNTLEANGSIPTLLPTPGLVPSVGAVLGHAVGTVETEVEQIGDTVGELTGTVESQAGELLGEVVDVDHKDD